MLSGKYSYLYKRQRFLFPLHLEPLESAPIFLPLSGVSCKVDTLHGIVSLDFTSVNSSFMYELQGNMLRMDFMVTKSPLL